MTSSTPSISVVLCTRNRPDLARECMASILANRSPHFELVVVDQSDYRGPAPDDERVRYHPSSLRGLSRARNEALELVRGEIVAFTDDDCLVPSDWTARIQSFFDGQPRLALAFGRVIAPPELSARGFLPGFEPENEVYEGSFPSPMRLWGMGANMALRRSLVERIGLFDPCLGAGGDLQSGEEFDLEMRVVGAGMRVAHTSAFEVTHLGVREHDSSRQLHRGYAVGTGAVYAKNIRLGTPGSSLLFRRWLMSQTASVVDRIVRNERPYGIGRTMDTLRGYARGMVRPLDVHQSSFVASVAACPSLTNPVPGS